MPTIAQIILLLIGLLILSLSLLFSIPSFMRREIRAGVVGLAGALLGAILLVIALACLPGGAILAQVLAGLGIAGLILLFLPTGRLERVHERPFSQVDERTIMFARWRLKPGTPEYEGYYRQHPEHQAADAVIPTLPGLLSPHAPLAETRAFAAAEAGFFMAEALREAVDGPVSPVHQDVSPQAASRYLKYLARYFGARNCGIAAVQPYQVYSHIGRGSGVYGAPVVMDHPYVLVFTFEMAEEMVRTAPRAQEAMETARQYSEAAQAAVQVAAWIRGMGYEALAHIDGNYRLILPLAGRDAGLGEIGRMGLLMTPDLGPRIRLSAVSTTLPLLPDPPGDSPAVLDFCCICRKCAENCPARAIPTADRQEIDGALRWQIDAEACFRYWNTVGTDCGRCMQVCPYSHADDPAHNLMRWLVARSGSARRLALRLDDWIYRRKPPVQPGPRWTRIP
jgi:ferredoxin